jgi:hypothetical protein
MEAMPMQAVAARRRDPRPTAHEICARFAAALHAFDRNFPALVMGHHDVDGLAAMAWPRNVRPKIHFSSPRTELRDVKRVDKKTKRSKVVKLPPVWTGHADFTNPFEFARFMRDADGLTFDVMLEAKAKDISLLKLRPDLLRYAPDVAARFGLYRDALSDLEAEEAALETLDDPVREPDVDEGATATAQPKVSRARKRKGDLQEAD